MEYIKKDKKYLIDFYGPCDLKWNEKEKKYKLYYHLTKETEYIEEKNIDWFIGPKGENIIEEYN